MLGHTTRPRAGFKFSPLVLIGVIFTAVVVIEALLAARFWIQLAASNAPGGFHALILDATRPLVAPFSGARETVQGSAGSFDRDTLFAGIVYLAGAVGLAMMSMLAGGLASGGEALSIRRRRSALGRYECFAGDHPESPRLICTASLRLTPEQTTRALKMLRFERFPADFFAIPVSGGCIVAAFAEKGAEGARWSPAGLAVAGRNTIALRRAFRAIERRFQPDESHARVFS